MKRNKQICGLTALILLLCMPHADGTPRAEAYAAGTPSQDEIIAFFAAHPWSTSTPMTFDEEPSYSGSYTAGRLSAASQQEVLNCINCIRFTAGLPADVAVKAEYANAAQAATLVNAANNMLSHSPERPAGMPETLYQLGRNGAGSSNLSRGRQTLCASIVGGFMPDSDNSNIDRLGHRRWVLNPDMQYTGFGKTGLFYAMFAIDRNRKEAFTGDYIAWPPQNMPYSLYHVSSRYPFSVTLCSGYDEAKLDSVKVDLRSEKTGKTYHLDGSCTNYDNYLNVDTAYYGIPNCIIFNPGVMFPEDDAVTVSVSGITKQGVPAPISYTVHFFDTDPPVRGDCTLDGAVSVDDAQCALIAYTQDLAGLGSGLNARQTKAADVNGDGQVTVEDAQNILRYYVENFVSGNAVSWEQLTGTA